MKSDFFRFRPHETLESPSDSDALSTPSTKSDETGLKPTDAAWAAGLIDGEGCITFSRSATVSIDSTSPSVIEEMYKIFGGKCRAVNRRTSTGRPVFRWVAYGELAVRVCLSTLEYLRDKREQASLLTSIYKYPANSSMRKAIILRIKTLKKVT